MECGVYPLAYSCWISCSVCLVYQAMAVQRSRRASRGWEAGGGGQLPGCEGKDVRVGMCGDKTRGCVGLWGLVETVMES